RRTEKSREARSTNIPLHPTTPRRKFNAFSENGLPGRDSYGWKDWRPGGVLLYDFGEGRERPNPRNIRQDRGSPACCCRVLFGASLPLALARLITITSSACDQSPWAYRRDQLLASDER